MQTRIIFLNASNGSVTYPMLGPIVSLCCNSNGCWAWVCCDCLSIIHQGANCFNVCKSVENNAGCVIGCSSLKNKVKSKLDISLSMVPTNYTGTHMSITRASNATWVPQCESSATNFTCMVYLGKMNVSIFVTHPVSNIST